MVEEMTYEHSYVPELCLIFGILGFYIVMMPIVWSALMYKYESHPWMGSLSFRIAIVLTVILFLPVIVFGGMFAYMGYESWLKSRPFINWLLYGRRTI